MNRLEYSSIALYIPDLWGRDRMNLNDDQIHYLKTVLGLNGVMLPQDLPAGDIPHEPAALHNDDSKTAFRESGSVTPEFFALAASVMGDFPLDGEAGDLARKMIQAIKIDPEQVRFIEWNFAHPGHPAPDLQPHLATAGHPPGKRPVLVFGLEAAHQLLQKQVKLGEWTEWSGLSLLTTLAPHELLQHPEKKKIAWAHLQTFMKRI